LADRIVDRAAFLVLDADAVTRRDDDLAAGLQVVVEDRLGILAFVDLLPPDQILWCASARASTACPFPSGNATVSPPLSKSRQASGNHQQGFSSVFIGT
jgi:hypothetical protein